MENYINKVCPFCKTEIKEEDTVKICPVCGVPHHERCWEENKGCAICGQKVGPAVDAGANSAILQSNTGDNRANEIKKKKPIKAIIAAVIVLAVIVGGILVIPKLFVSVEDLCAREIMRKPTQKASGAEKNEVLAENVIAYLSMESSDNLKDPLSFSLRDAYYVGSYNEGEDRIYQQAVLYISGTNSYGASVSRYWLWTADENGEWGMWGTCSNLNLDPDDDDYLISVIAKVIVEDDNAIKLKKTSVKNINEQFENDTLHQVAPIDNDNLDTSVMPISSSDE